MQLLVNLDDKVLEGYLREEIATLPKEAIREVILEGFKNLMCEKSFVEGLLIKKESYTSYRHENTPSDLLMKLISGMSLDPAFKEIEKFIIDYIKNNYRAVVVDALCQNMLKGMFESDNFKYAVRASFMQFKYEEENKR